MNKHCTLWTACDAVLFYCRPGFESDSAAEIMDLAAAEAVPGWCRAEPDTGMVRFHTGDHSSLQPLLQSLHWRGLIFPRQWLGRLAALEQLPEADRVAAIVDALPDELDQVSDVLLEYPDTNEGKALSRFCKRFRGPLLRGLERRLAIRSDSPAPRLHLYFQHSAAVELALGHPQRSAPWPLGVPRLRMPREAPSRSTLKLDEALMVLLTEVEKKALLAPGNTAVDLGAAPGGWTWQLTNRSLRVIAVDNGPMSAVVMDTGLVDHRREDGFRFRPARPVDLLVCDMVEQPSRIAGLMGQWLQRGDCRGAIFNLKLPMKQRYRNVRECLQRLPTHNADGQPLRLRCRQLFHDRDEVTVAMVPDHAGRG
ncbi:MAG: 23S rRNA (cytidine(2498)-2'-O)-methyltransferase RlmM [Ectothiorhodospiraceae bacterium]|nr:23S rRNA (cytidine(2498)-2'-O)-methyltransferase RlmM [Ectothiorhodospiraceae bacterium]